MSLWLFEDMYLLDLTLPLPEENVALDEALLNACETGEITGGVLRLWEPDNDFVVLGRSSDVTVEVNLAACRAQNIPILRRVSGGGTILTGPGCLMYAVVLSYADHADARDISAAHRLVLTRITDALLPLVANINLAGTQNPPPRYPGAGLGEGLTKHHEQRHLIQLAGTSDLALSTSAGLQKFSGNALRCKRNHFLYHGTLLYDFDLDRVSQLLAQQTREPVYRAGRTHRAFIANLPASRAQLVAALTQTWNATEPLSTWPEERMRELVRKMPRGI
jgi:lipoate-protein ligase A